MRASELIKNLEKCIEKFGDLDVRYPAVFGALAIRCLGFSQDDYGDFIGFVTKVEPKAEPAEKKNGGKS